MIRQTSLWSYQEIKPKISERQQQILDVLVENGEQTGLTDQEITGKLGKSDPNYVRPRRFELYKLGIVIDYCKRVCKITGKISTEWRLLL